MMKAVVFSALLVSAAAVSSGAAMQAQSELEQVKQSIMAQGADLFKLNAMREGVKHVHSPKASALLQGKSAVKQEDLEAWKDSGLAVEQDINLATITHAHQTQFTGASFEKKLKDLEAATDGSRYIGHPGNRKAAMHIMNACKAAGFAVKEHHFDYNLPNVAGSFRQLGLMRSMFEKNGNIACYKKGTDPVLSQETVVIGAHYDSVNWRENLPTGMKNAPGIDDNGSGTAAILLIADALKTHESKRSILLVGFNAEEEGLLGSKAFVPAVVASKEYGTLKAALIADEIAFPGRKEKGLDRKAIFETSDKCPGVMALVDTAAHNVEDVNGAIAGFEVNRHGFGSDHMSFIDNGIPAMLLIERDDEWRADVHGHSAEDTFDDLNMDFGASMARLLFRTGMALANPK